ncbi:MAG: hypothetical protein KGI80_02400 [Verrucomicrobiota bacterium]|nr:hypothetical protein [Verrucomicrobiota bacterium]
MIKTALAFDGRKPSLGFLSAGSVEIRAFGPEVAPLGSGAFGIRSLSYHGGRWASPRAQPEIWFSAELRSSERESNLELSFFGLSAQNPLFFAFYVSARSALVGVEEIRAGGLKHYAGDPLSVQFDRQLQLSAQGVSHLEVKPIAPEAFWQCYYFLAFTLIPSSPKVIFSFSV